MEAGVKVSYPATVIEETDVEKQLLQFCMMGTSICMSLARTRTSTKCCFI